MKLNDHPRKDEIRELILNECPGVVLVSVGDIKIKSSLRLLQKKIKTDFGLFVSLSNLQVIRSRYGGTRRDTDLAAMQRLSEMLL